MGITVKLVCLVTLAILIAKTVAQEESCPCTYVPAKKGCTLGPNQKYKPDKVCRCIHKTGAHPTCSGTFVGCYDPGVAACITADNTFEHCMQGVYEGQGDCCGYPEAEQPSCKDRVNSNTRLFGLGNVINGALGAVGGTVAGGLNGGLQGANPGFQPGFNRPPGFQNQQFPVQGVFQGQQFPGQGVFQGQQFPGQQNPGQGFFTGQQFPGQQFPGQQFPGQQFQGQGGFPGQQFPGQQFPGQQFPVVPTGNIPVGAAIVNPGISDNRPIVQGVSNSCRRWCKWRNEQGLLQNYCCEFANDPQTVAATKGGLCPLKRPSCPPTRFFTGPPVVCSSDGRCPGTDKCCPDACLQHHTCKPIQGTGK